jgi:hypothetical protein
VKVFAAAEGSQTSADGRRKYLPLYIAEAQFRYNNRHNPDIFGAAIAGL